MINQKPSTPEVLQNLVDIWDEAASLEDACIRAGRPLKDPRGRLRLKKKAEEAHGVVLPVHNAQHSTAEEKMCPSTLDIAAARKAKGIITTSYTNNTTIVTPFLETLKVFAKAKGFQLLVRPICYRNPTCMTDREPLHWDERIYPYVINEDFHLNRSLVFSAVSLQATTANPLAGKQIAYRNKSVVYGSGSLECDSVATPKGRLPKMLFATGSLNLGKYSNSNAGIKAAARHVVSAIVFVKVGDYNRDHILEWDGNGFSFFKEYWTPAGLSQAPAKYKALHLGDVHSEGLTPQIIKQRGRLIEHLDPEEVIWNDLHNHGAGSHHNTMLDSLMRQQQGRNCVKSEIQMSADVVNKLGKGRKNIIVGSNHHDHLDQWLNRFKPHNDIQNAEYYFWLMARIAENPDKTPFELAMEDLLDVDYEFQNGDTPYYAAGIDVSQHGHQGPDGARSSVGFHKLSCKIQSGHTHKRWIKGLHWTSGVLPLELGYNKGYGTWSSTDTAITAEGTRTHITFIKGKYWV